MRDEWYGDKRDLVKWGGILNLCHDVYHDIGEILWVVYYRMSDYGAIHFTSLPLARVSDAVKKHFRDIKRISNLDNRIRILDEPFNQRSRQEYTNRVCESIRQRSSLGRKLVFLDPDTGLQPERCEAEHVSRDELKKIWETLSNGDLLVFYQHHFRKPDWIEIRRGELAECCQLDISSVEYWTATNIAKDVVFFFVEKK